MTTDLVMTITDELVAELEANIDAVWHRECKANTVFRALLSERAELKRENEALASNLRGKHAIAGATYATLIAERDELKRDAERYRFIRDDVKSPIYCREIEFYNGRPCGAHNVKDGQLDSAIDQAMQERQE